MLCLLNYPEMVSTPVVMIIFAIESNGLTKSVQTKIEHTVEAETDRRMQHNIELLT